MEALAERIARKLFGYHNDDAQFDKLPWSVCDDWIRMARLAILEVNKPVAAAEMTELLARMEKQLGMWEDDEPRSDWWQWQLDFAEAFTRLAAANPKDSAQFDVAAAIWGRGAGDCGAIAPTQADRDAAASVTEGNWSAAEVSLGQHDDTELVQAFARHARAAIAKARGES